MRYRGTRRRRLAGLQIFQRSGERAIECGSAGTEVPNSSRLQHERVQVVTMRLPNVFSTAVEREQGGPHPLLRSLSLYVLLGIRGRSEFIIAGGSVGWC